MRIEERSHVVPEVREDFTVFIADDGTEFCSEKDCKDYEHKQNLIKNSPALRNRAVGAEDFEGYHGELYNIQTQEDYNAVVALKGLHNMEPDFTKLGGPGWYIYIESDLGYSYKTLKNYDQYVKGYLDDIHRVIEKNKKLIEEAEKEVKEGETICPVCSNSDWNGYISWYEMKDCQTVIHDEKATYCPVCGRKVR